MAELEVVDKRRFDSDGEVNPEMATIRRGRSVAGVVPAFDRVLVRLIAVPQGETLVVRPSAFDEPTDLAEVISIGQGVFVGGKFIEIPFAEGDIVKFSANTFEESEFHESDSDHKYGFVRAQDVRCFWKPDAV